MKIKDYIRGTQMPSALTMEGWAEWNKQSSAAHPFRHWLVEEFFDDIYYRAKWPFDKLYDIKCYITNRWISKTHYLHTGLKKGQYRDLDTCILHGLFNELVLFVEIDLAMKNVFADKQAFKKFNAPWYLKSNLYLGTWRSAPAGLDFLDWEMSLTQDSDMKNLKILSDQAQKAKDILELYNWWVNVHQKRPDPYVSSGWEALSAEKTDPLIWKNATQEYKAVWKVYDEIENNYHAEDDLMVLKLMSIRRSLWS